MTKAATTKTPMTLVLIRVPLSCRSCSCKAALDDGNDTGSVPTLRRLAALRLEGPYHPLAELEHALVQAGPVVLEVDDEPVAAFVDVLLQTLGDPLRWACDRMAAALVAPRLRLGPK